MRQVKHTEIIKRKDGIRHLHYLESRAENEAGKMGVAAVVSRDPRSLN
jgi:hypothetical protein